MSTEHDFSLYMQLIVERRFEELAARGVTMSGGPTEALIGWLRAPLTGMRAHYFKQVRADMIGPDGHGRLRLWEAMCVVEAVTSDRVPMFEPGNWPQCQRCQQKLRRKRP